MSYLVLARKYRPQTFEDVVQQGHVTRTLANAIQAGRLAHAILFSGPRGTGKTTVARILAKAMNCSQGPTAIPCNKCRSCEEITSGHAADVFEIDGASNNSVDQVRELRDNLKYMPAHSRFKIYIIDEVHMLSLSAFNALLKTLEEPPAHVLFMFATTEVHKIPITILSRCQRHDMRRIDNKEIVNHLERICAREQVVVDAGSLVLIAQEAGGSMRDAMSLLDHILACAQGPVTAELIGDLLGIVDRSQLFDFSAAVLKADLTQVLEQIDSIWRKGYEIKRFYNDLVTHFHALATLNLGAQASRCVDLPAHEIELMKDQIREVSQTYLVHICDFLFQAEHAIKLSGQPRYALEMVFFKLFQHPPKLSIDELIQRLDQLRQTVGQIPTKMMNPPAVQNLQRRESPAQATAEAPPAVVPDADLQHTVSRAGMTEPFTEDQFWSRLLERVGEQKPSLAAQLLNKGRLTALNQHQADLEVTGNDFTLKRVTEQIPLLKQIGSELVGRPLDFKIAGNIEDQETRHLEKKKTEQSKYEARNHPMVMEALKLFDGQVWEVNDVKKK